MCQADRKKSLHRRGAVRANNGGRAGNALKRRFTAADSGQEQIASGSWRPLTTVCILGVLAGVLTPRSYPGRRTRPMLEAGP
jgi:hypothetical protein